MKSSRKLLEVNIMWGMINLLPMFPLDGGQISRELLNIRNPRYGAVAVAAAFGGDRGIDRGVRVVESALLSGIDVRLFGLRQFSVAAVLPESVAMTRVGGPLRILGHDRHQHAASFFWARVIWSASSQRLFLRFAKRGVSRSKSWSRWGTEGRMDKILRCWGEKFLEFFPAHFGEIYKTARRCQRRLSSRISGTIFCTV